MKLFGFILAFIFWGALVITANIVGFPMFTILVLSVLTLSFIYNIFVLTGEYKSEKRSDVWKGISLGTIVISLVVAGWYAYLYFG